MKTPLLIAEVKTKSPFGYISKETAEEQFKFAHQVGSIVSIHTSPEFGGSWKWLEECCNRSNKPILAKGFHNTIKDVRRAFDCGATYVLTVGWWSNEPRNWFEAQNYDDLTQSDAVVIVANHRDPHTGESSFVSISEYIHNRLKSKCQTLVEASMISHKTHVSAYADYVLVGAGLRQYVKSLYQSTLTRSVSG